MYKNGNTIIARAVGRAKYVVHDARNEPHGGAAGGLRVISKCSVAMYRLGPNPPHDAFDQLAFAQDCKFNYLAMLGYMAREDEREQTVRVREYKRWAAR